MEGLISIHNNLDTRKKLNKEKNEINNYLNKNKKFQHP